MAPSMATDNHITKGSLQIQNWMFFFGKPPNQPILNLLASIIDENKIQIEKVVQCGLQHGHRLLRTQRRQSG